MIHSKHGLDSYMVIAKLALMNGIPVSKGLNQSAFLKALSGLTVISFFVWTFLHVVAVLIALIILQPRLDVSRPILEIVS